MRQLQTANWCSLEAISLSPVRDSIQFHRLKSDLSIYETLARLSQLGHYVFTLGTRGFSRVRREFSVLAEGRHVFGRCFASLTELRFDVLVAVAVVAS